MDLREPTCGTMPSYRLQGRCYIKALILPVLLYGRETWGNLVPWRHISTVDNSVKLAYAQVKLLGQLLLA